MSGSTTGKKPSWTHWFFPQVKKYIPYSLCSRVVTILLVINLERTWFTIQINSFTKCQLQIMYKFVYKCEVGDESKVDSLVCGAVIPVIGGQLNYKEQEGNSLGGQRHPSIWNSVLSRSHYFHNTTASITANTIANYEFLKGASELSTEFQVYSNIS